MVNLITEFRVLTPKTFGIVQVAIPDETNGE